ncbi:MAG: hypothetical protein RQ757_11225 [Pseudomonadales bacterium]|nr:hypothetical protein [Pseudomonadales bacterium]
MYLQTTAEIRQGSIGRLMLLPLLALVLAACATTSVRSTEFVPAVQNMAPADENQLLDIGVMVFDPGLDEIKEDELERTNFEIRRAESRFVPYQLAETLQGTGNWGVVRVMPNDITAFDILLSGQILLSNGESMILKVTASDSTGRVWYEKEYEEKVSQFSYDLVQRQANDPFQAIYNTIANDLLAWRNQNLDAASINNIRKVTELQFARSFAPDIFGQYLSTNRQGITQVVRLPADNDPYMARMRDIRQRDNLFVDTVQDYYQTFAMQMRVPYDSWREQSYHETLALAELERSARRRFLTGAAAIVGGIAMATSNNSAAQAGSLVGVGAGAYLVKSGFDRTAEAKIHIEALRELGESLETEIAPKVIDLDDRTIMLNGTVEEQYQQWRDILVQIYQTEIGEIQ